MGKGRGFAAALLLFSACGGAAATPSPTLRSALPTLAAPSATARASPTANPCPVSSPSTAARPRVVIELAKGGAITLELRPDKAPNTVKTFLGKVQSCFYDGLTFHRVVPNFVIQGGDPLGTGTGGGNQPTELSDLPFVKGTAGIARGGDIKVSNDSQFYIVIGEARHLDGQYTNFGQVASGQDVADKVQVGDRIKSIRASQ